MLWGCGMTAQLTTPTDMTDDELRREFNRVAAIAYQRIANCIAAKSRMTRNRPADYQQMDELRELIGGAV